MKKILSYKWYALAALIILPLLLWYLLNEGTGTINKKAYNFRIEHPEQITGIELEGQKETASLTLENGIWYVNTTYTAHELAIKTMISAIDRIRMLAPVSKSISDAMAEKMKKHGCKITLYRYGSKFRSYTVLTDTVNNRARSFMKHNNRKEIFEVFIPGYNASLEGYFVPNPNYWRDKSLLKAHAKDICKINVQYFTKQDASFELLVEAVGTYQIKKINAGSILNNIDKFKVESYLQQFTNIHFETFVGNDSVLKSIPKNKDLLFSTISINTIQGSEKSLEIFKIPANTTDNETGKVLKTDPNRCVGLVNKKDLVIIRYIDFEPILKEANQFISTKP